MRSLVTFAASAALLGTASAQVFRDDFSYPNGGVIPGWTQQRGVWQVQNGRISTTSGSFWSYITADGFNATRSVIDGEFFFVGAGVQFTGLTSRHPGGNLDSNLLMVKIQNNGGVADFDRVFAYEQVVPLGTFFTDIPGGTQSAYCRMITTATEFWIETDADKDGDYELVLPRRPITLPLTGTMVGMNAYATSQADNFEFFDAVLTPQPGATANVGLNFNLDLMTPSPNAVWFGLIGLGNTGFAIGSRAIPVDGDAIAVATFGNPAIGMVGVTDTNGDAVVSIPIPPLPFLVGLRLFTSAMTLDAAQPFGIGNISNEQAFVIVP